VSGDHPLLPPASEVLPISGLSNVHEFVKASRGSDPQRSFNVTAELSIVLGARQISMLGFSAARVRGCDPLFDFGCLATGRVQSTIVFELSAPTASRIHFAAIDRPPTPPGPSEPPLTTLTHASLGFALRTDFDGGAYVDCGSLTEGDCSALFGVFGPGAVLPAGGYQLTFSVRARDTGSGSCALGCDESGGSYRLELVPEPDMFLLLTAGVLTALRRRAAPQALAARLRTSIP
jgi:hypothetical protein